jgi:hypothetical protein
MSVELIRSAGSKASAQKKESSEERKALRSEMNGLYAKIADSIRRRTASGWSRP